MLAGSHRHVGYSDVADSWVNTGGLLERFNFGLALASNRIPGTRVNLQRLLDKGGQRETQNKAEIMDRFLGVIVAGEISPKTKAALMKQMDQEIVLAPAPAPDTSRAPIEVPHSAA